MQVKFLNKQHIQSDIDTYLFEKPEGFGYTAGQFITLHLPIKNPDERGVKHWFTLSSSPTEDYLSITTRFMGAKASTFKQALHSLKPDTLVQMDPPEGDFTLPDDNSKRLVFVAGGIGITPFRSIVKYLGDKGEKRSVHLIYAASKVDDFVFKDLFEDYGAKVDLVVKEPQTDWEGETGQLSGERILRMAGDTKNTIIYVSGPEPMVESLEAQLKEEGLPENQLKTDFFPGYQPV